LNLHGLAATGS